MLIFRLDCEIFNALARQYRFYIIGELILHNDRYVGIGKMRPCRLDIAKIGYKIYLARRRDKRAGVNVRACKIAQI